MLSSTFQEYITTETADGTAVEIRDIITKKLLMSVGYLLDSQRPHDNPSISLTLGCSPYAEYNGSYKRDNDAVVRAFEYNDFTFQNMILLAPIGYGKVGGFEFIEVESLECVALYGDVQNIVIVDADKISDLDQLHRVSCLSCNTFITAEYKFDNLQLLKLMENITWIDNVNLSCMCCKEQTVNRLTRDGLCLCYHCDSTNCMPKTRKFDKLKRAALEKDSVTASVRLIKKFNNRANEHLLAPRVALHSVYKAFILCEEFDAEYANNIMDILIQMLTDLIDRVIRMSCTIDQQLQFMHICKRLTLAVEMLCTHFENYDILK